MILFLFFSLIVCAYSECQPVSVQQNFNITEFTRATWYIQYQQVTGYLPENQFYCVTATYSLDEKKTVPLFRGTVVAVHNYANIDQVNGRQPDMSNQTLCARQPDPREPAKLLVAPCFLPNILAGDYWILAAGPGSNNYEWAVVIGGQPTEEYDDGCTTKTDGINGSGFWFFSRTPVASLASLQTAFKAATDQGISLSLIKPVNQEGCKYIGAYIKPDSTL